MVTGAATLPSLGLSKLLGGAVKSPGLIQSGLKAAGSAIEGAGYGGLFGFAGGEGGVMNRLDSAQDSAALGGVVGGGASTVAKGAGKAFELAGKGIKEAGRKLELSAFGGTKAVISKLNDKARELFDEIGQYKNPLGEAISSFRSAGGGNAGMEGQTLVKELKGQTQTLNKAVGKLISEAEQSQVDPIIPNFKTTAEYVNGLAGVEKKAAEELANDLISKTVNNTDGSLSSLQSEKEKLSEVISDTAWGDDANPIKTNILKRIRSDLRQAIEAGYQSLTGKPAAEIAGLNAELGKRYALQKPFKDILASGEARDPIRAMIQTLRTSGGVGQTGIALAAGAPVVGLPLAGALAVGNLAAQTPGGKRVLSDLFKSAPVQSIFKAGVGVSKAADRFAVGAGAAQAGRAAAEPLPSKYEQPKKEPQSQSRLVFPSSNSNITKNATQRGQLKGKKAMTADSYADDPIIKAVISQESGGNAKAVSDAGAQGLMQILPSTAAEIAKDLGMEDFDLKDPQTNVKIGTEYLRRLLKEFGGDVELALTAYHSGPNRVKSLLARAKGSKLADIKKYLGPVGQKYAAQVLGRLNKA
jgi:soluble lytic murein transglycosylase-like protein/DNA-directed RNA polymerase subunit F